MSSAALRLSPAERTTAAAPGAALRATALAGTAACGLAVISGTTGPEAAHDLLAALALPPLAAVAVAAWAAQRRLLVPALWAVALFGLAAAVTIQGVHVTLAAGALAASATTSVLAFRGEHMPAGAWRDYLTLTKPRVMSLLLVTGAGGMFVGAGGAPPVGDVVVMLVGLALACGGASALNHVMDRDIDRLMGKRTQARPVAAGRLPASRALEFGVALSAASFVLLASLANVLTAVLALAGNLFYVFVYTGWLKRSTPQNIVIGGAAGAVPPLVGWAAATGELSAGALYLFLVVFLWTPPHFWALALLIRPQYEAAEVPMLPVVRGERETVRQIGLYSLLLVAVTLTPLAWGMFGAVYAVSAAALGAGLLWLTWQLWRQTTPRHAALLFHYSLAYLGLLFVAMSIDSMLT